MDKILVSIEVKFLIYIRKEKIKLTSTRQFSSKMVDGPSVRGQNVFKITTAFFNPQGSKP